MNIEDLKWRLLIMPRLLADLHNNLQRNFPPNHKDYYVNGWSRVLGNGIIERTGACENIKWVVYEFLSQNYETVICST